MTDIEALRDIIRGHDYLYYKLAQPKISDYHYDMMFKRLQKMEADDPSLITDDSPTQVVGGKSAEIYMGQHDVR